VDPNGLGTEVALGQSDVGFGIAELGFAEGDLIIEAGTERPVGGCIAREDQCEPQHQDDREGRDEA
jgi:hypothetical protein